MDEPLPQLEISLSVQEGDPEEVAKLTRALRSEVEQLDVESVESVSAGAVPAGAKAGEWQALGQMAVTLAPVLIPPFFDLLKSWIQRQPSTPVKITVKVGRRISQVEYDPTKVSADELRDLVRTLQRSPRK